MNDAGALRSIEGHFRFRISADFGADFERFYTGAKH